MSFRNVETELAAERAGLIAAHIVQNFLLML
jgi:hypothetical protein